MDALSEKKAELVASEIQYSALQKFVERTKSKAGRKSAPSKVLEQIPTQQLISLMIMDFDFRYHEHLSSISEKDESNAEPNMDEGGILSGSLTTMILEILAKRKEEDPEHFAFDFRKAIDPVQWQEEDPLGQALFQFMPGEMVEEMTELYSGPMKSLEEKMEELRKKIEEMEND